MNPAGEVNKEELKKLSGATNVAQNETHSSFIPGPGTCLTAAICPTTGMCNKY
ncbi:class II lanthipeptide, LchA2/BrtA2 family [Bacillus halotolerans]|uniref:class II lanthipeptide, LchA2/BrtA2 family n=1 Tax=Bacillus halotolerans TaxID=260554 RepID=UPI001879A5AB